MIPILLFPLLWTFAFGSNTKGVLNLDSWTFDKVVDGSRNVLVMFDKEYPYGDYVDRFKEFASKVGEMGVQSQDLIIAQVGKTDYGDIKNIDLHERFHVEEKDFPVFKLFKKGNTEASSWDVEKEEITLESLSHFVQSSANVWIGLPGCIKEFNDVAKIFMSTTSEEERANILDEKSRYLAEEADETNKDSVKAYVRVMKKILEKGEEFIKTEKARIKKLQNGKITEKKKELFQRRLNVLGAFEIQKTEKVKEEL